MSGRKKVIKEDSKFKVGIFRCSGDNLFGCLVRKSLDTSITGKLIGMLIVSLLGFTLVIILHTLALNSIHIRTQEIQKVSIPQYKVSQFILRSLNGFKISLLHILAQEKIDDQDKNIIANQQRLAELGRMLVSLQDGGTIMDIARVSEKTLDVFNVQPSSQQGIRAAIARIDAEYGELDSAFRQFVTAITGNGARGGAEVREEALYDLLDSLDDMHELVTNFAVMINDQHNTMFGQTGRIIDKSRSQSVLIGLVIATILTIGTILYIMLIVLPLKDILAKIKFIAKGEGDLTQRIDVKTQDEVGQLARHLNHLVDNIFSINSFKAVIEEEESTTEVHQRLANLVMERYHFNKLFLYELVGNKNSMSVAFASDLSELCSPDILDDSDFCRAKRTGHPISSIQYPHICKQFPHGDRYEHHCIPMIANGRVVGVAQFLIDSKSLAAELQDFEDKVKRARRYIKEATPVVEAKRFASALQETTMKDPMTDLYNRRFLETYTETLVASTVRRHSKIGILMCDMDFFKEVNDNYGHETGDIVLIKTAEVLKSCVRASDMVIRYGGEEFLILLIDVKERGDVEELAERIRATMESTIITIPDGTLKKTISIGYSEFPEDTEGFWESIKFADVALLRAKQEGRNRVVAFTQDMWSQGGY